MPMLYSVAPGATQTAHVTPGTEADALFVHPGARNVALVGLYPRGAGQSLTAISGLGFRVKKQTTATSTIGTGTAITPAPRDPGMQAAKANAAFSATAPTLFAGGGTPVLQLSVGCGAASGGGWVAVNPDDAIVVEGSANQSIDVFSVAGLATAAFELGATIQE